jgi:TolB protein
MVARAWVLRSVIWVVALLLSGCGPLSAAIPAAAPGLLQRPDRTIGKLVYVREGNLWIYQDGEARQLTTGGTWRQPALSPDGSEIAYAYREPNFSDLFAMAADGSSSRRLTRGQSPRILDNDWSLRPAWSPDGSQIAYVSDADSSYTLVWVMNKDGSGRRQLVTPSFDVADAISWSPDGKRLAVTGMVGAMTREPTQIYLVEVPRGATERLTNHPLGAFDPAWSPDGELLAYVAREAGRLELRVRTLDGAREAKLDKLAYVRSPAWSPDGRSIAVLSAQTGDFEIWIASIQAEDDGIQLGEFRQLTRDGGVDAASGLTWSR